MPALTGAVRWYRRLVAHVAIWTRLRIAGRSFGVACVGLEALEHMPAYEHLDSPPRTTLH